MDAESIDVLLVNRSLPWLRLDPEHGYRPTLTYLGSLPDKEGLLDHLWEQRLAEKSTHPHALLFLALSDLPSLEGRADW